MLYLIAFLLFILVLSNRDARALLESIFSPIAIALGYILTAVFYLALVAAIIGIAVFLARLDPTTVPAWLAEGVGYIALLAAFCWIGSSLWGGVKHYKETGHFFENAKTFKEK